MIGKEDVEKLSKLARIEISPEEKETLMKDIDSILSYVGQISQVGSEKTDDNLFSPKNVLRDDEGAHESGIYTREIIAEAPDSEDGFIKVKNIL